MPRNPEPQKPDRDRDRSQSRTSTFSYQAGVAELVEIGPSPGRSMRRSAGRLALYSEEARRRRADCPHMASSSATSASAFGDVEGRARSGSPHLSGLTKNN